MQGVEFHMLCLRTMLYLGFHQPDVRIMFRVSPALLSQDDEVNTVSLAFYKDEAQCMVSHTLYQDEAMCRVTPALLLSDSLCRFSHVFIRMMQ